MKRANLPFGSTPPQRHPDARRPGESHTRLTSTRPVERRMAPQRVTPPLEPSERRYAADAEEPRTGVVRRIDVPNTRVRPAPAGAERARQPSARPHADAHAEPARSAARSSAPSRDLDRRANSARDDERAWRCLEWGQPAKERRRPRDPKLSTAQLSESGELVRHHGPDAWLPEAGDFMHKMAGLIAQGFGFVRCNSMCLKTASQVLAVSEVGDTQIMAVSGPTESMSHVLKRAGLE